MSIITQDNIPSLVAASTTSVTLAATANGQPTAISIGGQQYALTAGLTFTVGAAGANSFDTGSTLTASSTYYVYAIRNLSTFAVALVASLTAPATGPSFTNLSGYGSAYKLIGTFQTNTAPIIIAAYAALNPSGTQAPSAIKAPTQSIATATASVNGGFNSGTYTTPAGVLWLRVRMVGGGGGGAGGSSNGGGVASTGNAGNSTTFGTSFLTANGAGTAPTGNGGGSGPGGSFTINAPAVGFGVAGGAGSGGVTGTTASGSWTGGIGGSSAFGGAGAGQEQGSGGAAAVNSGSGGGGGCGATQVSQFNGAGGGAGGFIDAIITNPLATYLFTVGAAVAGGNAGGSGFAGGGGAAGMIIVEEHYY